MTNPEKPVRQARPRASTLAELTKIITDLHCYPEILAELENQAADQSPPEKDHPPAPR